MKFSTRLLLLLPFLASACIDPLDLKPQTGEKLLVVDGMITNEMGPATIRLSNTAAYVAYSEPWNTAETGATLTLTDDQGQQEQLLETSPGVYKTSGQGLQGQAGRTYTLHITTKAGKTYRSQPQLLRPVSAIDSLYTQVRQQKILNSSGNEQQVYVVEVLVDAPDPAETKDFYMWQWEGVYRVNAQPWDHTIKVRGVRVPAPKDCCQICWVTEFTNSINVSDDRLVNGQLRRRHLVTQIPVNERTFEQKYRIEVKQLSLSEEAYRYWSMLRTQVSRVGNIQDPPPATLEGNISNVENPGEKVLGFFGASAVTKKAVFIKREELGMNPGEMIFPDDCRVLTNSTTTQPAYW
ncbi:MAG: DUF4249 domain-containing protein [Adhaeribacter sp.]